MAQLQTVQIQDPDKKGDFIVIDKSAFDPKEHKLYVEPKSKKDDDEEDKDKKGDGEPAKGAKAKKDDDEAPEWVLRAHVTDAIAAALESKGFGTPEGIVAASEDQLMDNVRMGRQIATRLKAAAGAHLKRVADAKGEK